MLKGRLQLRTLLIVGEGSHEVAFLQHIKCQMVSRGCGLRVTIKNAHGKGAMHVLEYATRISAGFDTCAVMVDTDTDYTSFVEAQAKTKGMTIIASDPCFEALLFRMLGVKPHQDRKKWKDQLMAHLGGDPADARTYGDKITLALLKKASSTEPALERLLLLFEDGALNINSVDGDKNV